MRKVKIILGSNLTLRPARLQGTLSKTTTTKPKYDCHSISYPVSASGISAFPQKEAIRLFPFGLGGFVDVLVMNSLCHVCDVAHLLECLPYTHGPGASYLQVPSYSQPYLPCLLYLKVSLKF